MRRLVVIFTVVMSVLAGAITSALADGALVTVAGKVANTNRGPFDPFTDGFLNYHDKTFEKAFELDARALAALPQQSITVDADVEDWPGAIAMEGPRLKDVLAAAGAEGGTVTLYALDGFGLEMTPERLTAQDWILASKAGGKPLGIGGHGPLWLVYDTAGRKATEDEEKTWVWSVFYIAVE
ncbi:hypothetical protein [Nitratireductor sp. ZSWI3]|uniref:hypothetical protein n=1 Tax=Nitratireductor sp. ZSWI3 TaxID=2966359 RepID=UPI00214F8BFC|nr:hypothetical protein [Nitratireductor sp. ZSWI3]MCR4268869.1 hypothetical protein [Nitratireductor sp. ZSWI3]